MEQALEEDAGEALAVDDGGAEGSMQGDAMSGSSASRIAQASLDPGLVMSNGIITLADDVDEAEAAAE